MSDKFATDNANKTFLDLRCVNMADGIRMKAKQNANELEKCTLKLSHRNDDDKGYFYLQCGKAFS